MTPSPSTVVPGRGAAAIALLVGLAIAPGIAAAALEDPRFEVYVAEPTVEPGAERALSITLVNDAADVEDRVRKAKEIEARMRSGDTPISVKSGVRRLGSLSNEESVGVSFTISVPRDIPSGTHELPIELDYVVGRDDTESRTVKAPVRVEDRARFAVVGTRTNLSVGETGPVTVALENVGSAAARDATVSLASRSAAVSVGGGTSDARFAGTWAPGETKTLTFEATVAPSAETQRYALGATVDYEDADGNDAASPELATGFVPRPQQEFAVANVSSSLQVGETGRIEGTVTNLGADPAHNAVVVLSADQPNLRPLETEYAVGTLPANGSARFSFQVRATEDAGANPRQFSVSVRYRDREDDVRRSDTIDLTAPVAAEQSFAVRDVRSTLRVGSEGTVEGTLVNRGPNAIRNAVLVLETGNPNVRPTDTEYALGDLEAGARTDFSFDVGVSGGTTAGPRQLTFRVRYRGGNDELRRSDALDVSVDVGEEQLFAVRDVHSGLRVGEEGTLELAVENTGGVAADNAVVIFESENPTANAVETEYAVGRLEPGERATASFSVEISEAADGGPRQFSVSVRYRDPNDDVRRSDPLDVNVDVAPQRDAFAVRPIEANVTAGSSATLRFEVENTGNETFSAISAKLFADDPLSSGDDEAFIGDLAPGESRTVEFAVSAAGGALEKPYPVSVDFQYDDADGDTLLSDTYTVSVQVERRQGGSSLPLGIAGAAVVVLAVGGYLWYRRR